MARINDLIDLEIDGRTYHVVCNMRTIDRIEQRMPSQALARRLHTEDPPISDMALVIHSALQANGHDMDYADVGHYVIDNMQTAYRQTMEVLGAALHLGPMDEEEPPKGKAQKGRKKSTGRSSTA